MHVILSTGKYRKWTHYNNYLCLQVAVHEIGHVLGLNHSIQQNSVMNAIYHRQITGDFELHDHDRSQIRELYGMYEVFSIDFPNRHPLWTIPDHESNV